MDEQANRRQQPRFPVKAGTADIQGFKRGPITDISKLGLSFRYIDFGYKNEDAVDGAFRVCITHGETFKLDCLPCTIVDDHCPLPKNHLSSGKMYRCCVKFEELTASQESLLEYFMDNYTVP